MIPSGKRRLGGIFIPKIKTYKEVTQMHIKVKRDFFDKKNNLQLRKKDEVLEVDDDRGKQLIELHLAEETKEPDKPRKKEAAG